MAQSPGLTVLVFGAGYRGYSRDDGYGGYYGAGYGAGYGSGAGGYGAGAGYGSGYGYGGYGEGYADGSGNGVLGGEMETMRDLFKAAAEAGTYTISGALREKNAELRRMMIECLGPDRLFKSGTTVIHRDIDGYGNKRELLRLPMQDTEAGYIQAVHVVCPTTGREYHLIVATTVKTCQEAAASTFKLRANEYNPIRES